MKLWATFITLKNARNRKACQDIKKAKFAAPGIKELVFMTIPIFFFTKIKN